ncbi:oncostatin-M-specific receptor subunit beta isoform X2 [Cynoglossus semilaevis]|uniref:oncostatin-M-specific receptor subunit beta isoform X2 n=1 Tax=Cynoglossus semilaevis TaxID=244447 RepID=UPI000D62C329|nr:oncostatin-M-specific receptor subunit beta-like isoform X2 [Cynoglossus semilaevis]XP_024908949.1 oncostatin-M-specific receptor subunit beta-like isoform X2 [Cynoglossus semilaevis]
MSVFLHRSPGTSAVSRLTCQLSPAPGIQAEFQASPTNQHSSSTRMFPVVKWHSVSPGATNTTLSWIIQGNLNELDLVCEISNNTGPATQVHCRSVDCPCKYKVEHLLPNTGYSVSLRCSVNGRLWGKWTQTEFKTLPFVTVNLWRRIISMNDSLSRNVTLLWTPDVPGSADTVTITGYTVQWWQKDKSESLWKNSGETEAEVCIGPEQYNLNVKASVHNGFSIPAHVIIPKLDDREKIPKKMQLSSSTAGGFNLSWTDYGNATCGYTVEWYIMGDTPPSLLQWKKIPEGYNALQLPADNFRAGCRYTFNIYGCTENGYKLLEIQTGYSQETVMVPRPRLVEPIQKTSSSVTLHWHYNEDDDSNPAFIIGYLVKVEDMGPNTQPGFRKAVLNVTVADPLRKFVTIEGLKQNHDYNFTVSALTKKGSGPAVSITIRTRINYSTLWVGSLIFILSLLGCTVLLCSQRKLLKRKVTELFVYPAGMNIRTVELQRFLEQTGEMVQPHRTEDCVSCEIHIVKFLPHVNKTPSTLQFPVAATTPFPASLSLTSPLLSSLTPSCMPVQDYSPQLVTLIEKDPALQQVNDITNMIYFHSMMDDFPEAEGDAMSGKVKLNFGPSDCQQESCIVTYGYISNEML